MKHAVLFIIIFWSSFLKAQTGTDCSAAIPLTLDGVCRNYATSSSTGMALVCTNYSGTSPVTYFTFTTNSNADKVLLDITSPTTEPCEVLLYSSGCGSMYSSSGMCFDDGKGLWSFADNFSVLPNATYKLRIKTTSTGNITICAKYYTPPNNNCAGAMSIGPTEISDNNASHSPGSEIISAAASCSFTLENTAFYNFYVASDGVCVVNVNNISCDNGNGNTSKGFQALFFKGSCSSLEHLGCESNNNAGSSSFLQFTTPTLPAGTRVTVAIDGLQGSNCSYNISGINILNVLEEDIEKFVGWKTPTSNLLKWTILNEGESVYLVERSENGRTFHNIGRLNSSLTGKSKADYSFEDHYPVTKAYYRIRQIKPSGKASLSSVILLERNDPGKARIRIVNPVIANMLDLKIDSPEKLPYMYIITNGAGQVVLKGSIDGSGTSTYYRRDVSSLSAGKYFITLTSENKKLTQTFIKLN